MESGFFHRFTLRGQGSSLDRLSVNKYTEKKYYCIKHKTADKETW